MQNSTANTPHLTSHYLAVSSRKVSAPAPHPHSYLLLLPPLFNSWNHPFSSFVVVVLVPCRDPHINLFEGPIIFTTGRVISQR